ncbi:MAG TPA: universal stress protein [Acidimicrobiales bacterium]|nr:universal stress protein [Acidimicrobiales bacterium]
MTTAEELPPVPADPLEPGGRIVVGIDESDHALIALRWGLREALVRKASVEVVHAWLPPVTALPFGATMPMSLDEGEIDAAARADLDKVVDTALAELGEAPEVIRTVLPGSAAPTLVEVSEGAALLVVGSHGRTGWRKLMLGSVADAVVQHAACPVVVVRLPRGDD